MTEGAAKRVRRLALAIAMAGVAAGAGGCGDGDGHAPTAAERRALNGSLAALQSTFEAGDRQRLCARMNATARRQVGLVADRLPGVCVDDVAEALETIDSGGGMRGIRDVRLVTAVVTDERATATVDLDGHGRVDVPLVRGGSGWLLGSFFGTPPAEAQAAASAAGTAPELDAERPVELEDDFGERCPALADADYPQVDGGCELIVSTSRVKLTIGTAFGHFEFGVCQLGYRVLVDGEGRTWTDSLHLRGPNRINNGCADVRACEDSEGDSFPWRGRISLTSDGRYVHRMDACFDTCIGFYAGPLTIGLSRGEQGGWRATAADAGVGASGLRFDGRMGVKPSRFGLAPASG